MSYRSIKQNSCKYLNIKIFEVGGKFNWIRFLFGCFPLWRDLYFQISMVPKNISANNMSFKYILKLSLLGILYTVCIWNIFWHAHFGILWIAFRKIFESRLLKKDTVYLVPIGYSWYWLLGHTGYLNHYSVLCQSIIWGTFGQLHWILCPLTYIKTVDIVW